MKLIYNGMDLAQLGTLRLLSHGTAREPAEAPQWERVTYRVRLDFFESNYRDNFGLIEQLREALKTQQAELLWQDESDTELLARTVTAAEDEVQEETGARGGNYWQAVVFSFWFYNHDVVTNCLAAVVADKDLGAVEKWEERVEVTRWDELRAARKLIQGGLTANGRLLAPDTTMALEDRQKWLLETKDALLAALVGGAEVSVDFGTFHRQVKISSFRAEVNQPHHYLAWSLTGTYLVYPNQADYALLDFKIIRRENHDEGIPRLILTGRIQSPSLAQATSRLALLKGSLVPAGWVTLSEETTEPRSLTESGTPPTGDGTVFTELGFNYEYRDTSGKACTYQRTGGTSLDLGTVDKFRDGYAVELFNEMRPHRKRAGGTVMIGGKWFAGETLSDADKVTLLVNKKKAWDAEVVKGSSGTLVYGTVFNQLVRVLDFHAQVDRLKYFIEWSLTASWTRFPNEADYALCELRVSDRQDRTEGTVIKTLSGRIGAPTPEAARAKLARLRTALIPAGYVLKTDQGDESRIDAESDLKGGTNKADGASFIELTVNEEWQKAAASVLSWRMRTVPEQDPRNPWIRTTISGTVTASGATAAAATATAQAQAAALGDNQGAFRVRASVSEIGFQVLTDQQVIVTVEFSYEYQSKATGNTERLYTEVTGERTAETFGYTVETVSGMISAPTLALAQATYRTAIRNVAAYQGALLLNERTFTLSQQRLDTPLASLAAGDDRFQFSFQVFRPKAGTESAISYALETASNWQTMEKVTAVNGTVFASTEAVANGLIDTLLGTFTLGKRVRTRRSPRQQQGPRVSGGTDPVTVFLGLDFSEEFIDLLTGLSGLLECECSEEVVYPWARTVVKPIPDGRPVIQQPGQTEGRRTVTARAVGTTESAAQAWVMGMRTALLTGSGVAGQTYELPPQVACAFRFLPQTAGVPRGDSANVRVAEVTGTFTELLLVGVLPTYEKV